MPPPRSPPPWEALELIGRLLDPATLAAASCVSKPFHAVMSSDYLWLPHCLTHFPSSLHLSPTQPPRRLFALFHTSTRRIRRSITPILSLNHLIFTVDVLRTSAAAPVLSLVKDGAELCNSNVFRFDVDGAAVVGDGEEVRVRWTVVKKGLTAAFTLMDSVGKGRAVGGGRWFTEKLAGGGCCGMVAEVGMEGEGEGGRLRLGLMYDLGCTYVCMEGALFFLQPFLLSM